MVDVLPSGLSGLSGLNTTGAWQNSVAVAPPGTSAAGLFALYPSRGDKTIAAATNITTVQDGPMQVVRYGALTVSAALTTTARNRGLMILCDSLTMGAAGSISMTARGAAGCSKWPVVDLTIPQSVALAASKISQRDVLSYITQNGIWIGDPVFWSFPDAGVADCRASITAGSVVLLSAAGCGAAVSPSTQAGSAGSNGGTGGGGPGNGYSPSASYNTSGGHGGMGRPWGGGSAGGAWSGDQAYGGWDGDNYGGPGGDAAYYAGPATGGSGNPGGAGAGGGLPGASGTGGVLVIICRGNVTRNATDSITANGVAGVSGGNASGSGSGGGHVSLIYGGTYTGTGTTTANGGAAGAIALYKPGFPGGAGSVVTKTFAQMGWT